MSDQWVQENQVPLEASMHLLRYLFLNVWSGFNRGHYEVSTGSSVEAMSIPFYQVTAVTELFVVPVLDVFLTPQYAN